MRPWRPQAGFSFLELVLVVAVLAVLASALTPAILQRLVDARVDATRGEEKVIYDAIIGNPDQPGNAGFVGDMGRLPATFAELIQGTGLPRYNTRTTGSVGMGWNGPYVTTGSNTTDYLADAFNRPYTGPTEGRIRSAGPDGMAGNADDIVFPASPIVIGGRVAVTVKTIADEKPVIDPPTCEVRLYYSANGVEQVLVDTVPPFVFENIPMGLHAIQVVSRSAGTAGAVLVQQTVSTPGQGRTRLVELGY